MLTPLTPGDFERFWSKVDMSGDCWLWTATRDAKGYGRFTVWHRSHSGLPAPWIAYEFSHGFPPEGWVLHSCDNPTCVRPTHLRTGSPRENTQDMLVRSRMSKKLTPEQVIDIRRRYKDGGTSQYALAREFGVSQGNIHMLLAGKTWRFLSGEELFSQ